MSKGNVPFSWEDMPGNSKAEPNQKLNVPANHKLPPPPGPRIPRKIPFHGVQNIPLPPCAFQPPPQAPPKRSLSKKGSKNDDDDSDDPFYVAYRECTKSSKESKKSSSLRRGGGLGKLRKHVFSFSCKRSCSVRDDNLIRPISDSGLLGRIGPDGDGRDRGNEDE